MRVMTPLFREISTTVTVIRGGGWDHRGQPIPEERIEVEECRLAWRATSEPVDRSDLTETTGVLYRRPPFGFYASDRIEVPDGNPFAGVWAVDGRPKQWHHGSEVPIRQE